MTYPPDEPAIAHINREERQHVRIQIPMELVQGQATFVGQDVSLSGFAVRDRADGQGLQDGAAELRLVLDGYHLAIPVKARQSWRAADSGLSGFTFTEIDQKQRDVLRRVIRSHLSGQRLNIEQAIAAEDGQTPPRRSSEPSGQGHRRSGAGKAVRLAAYGGAVVILIGLVGISAYERFLTIESDFAAVTAPEVVLRAPIGGLTTRHGFEPGDRVRRDQTIMAIEDGGLESEIAIAEATVAYNLRLAENLQRLIDQLAESQVSDTRLVAPIVSSLETGDALAFEDVSVREAEARIEAFQVAAEFEQSRLAGLRRLEMSGEVVAPCDCLIDWARPGGAWVEQGDELVRLVSTDPNRLLVEATVHLDQISRIEVHQRAEIRFPHEPEPVEARVHAINLDRESQPRAGFPDWVSHDLSLANVLLVTTAPLAPEHIGIPIEVRFIQSNAVTRVAHEASATVMAVLGRIEAVVGRGTAELAHMVGLAQVDRNGDGGGGGER